MLGETPTIPSISDETIKPNSSSEVKDQSSTRFSVTSQQDAIYLDAVRRGDMETAQRMVDEAKRVTPVEDARTGVPITVEAYLN